MPRRCLLVEVRRAGTHLPKTTIAPPNTSLPFRSSTSTKFPVDMEVVEVDQDSIPPVNVPSANGPAVPPIVPETTQATSTSTFAPWRTSRRTTGKSRKRLSAGLKHDPSTDDVLVTAKKYVFYGSSINRTIRDEIKNCSI